MQSVGGYCVACCFSISYLFDNDAVIAGTVKPQVLENRSDLQ